MSTLTLPRARRSAEPNALSGEAVASRTVVLLLERKSPTFRRGLASDAIVNREDTVDREMIHISKDLLDRAALARIVTADNAIRNWLLTYETPCRLLARGMWLFGLDLMEQVDQRVAEYMSERAAAVRELRERYSDVKADAERKLGEHFDESEYPDEDALEAAFAVKARWLSFDVNAALKGLSAKARREVQRRTATEWEDEAQAIRQALRESFAGIVETMAERLAPDADSGKPKAFRGTSVEKMRDFLATFAARDVTGDAKLAALAAKAGRILEGVDKEDLGEEATRSRVVTGMAQIQKTLVAMDVVAPAARRFRTAGEV